MRTGTIISGIGHLGLILWLLFGGLLTSSHEAPPILTSDVSLLSSADLAQMTAAASPPPGKPQTDVAAPKPDAAETPPAPAPQPDAVPKPAPAPKPTPVPKADAKPVVPKKVPAPAKVDTVPPSAPPPPEPTPAPEVSPTPPPKPAPRIAPTPAPAPKPDVKVADVPQPEVAPDATPAPTPKPPKEAAAPKEAATQIVPETKAPDASVTGAPQLAPKASPRPLTRPTPPAPDAAAPDAVAAALADSAAKPGAKPAKPATMSTAAAMAAALAAADGGGGTGQTKDATPTKSSGPPLTAGQTSGLLSALRNTWIVDPGSSAANVTVTVAFSLNPDGTVIPASVKLLSNSGGDAGAVQVAFEKARRAILRGSSEIGFNLPPDKYDQWRDIEMVFNPDGMRLK
jgi:hypothetical protein